MFTGQWPNRWISRDLNVVAYVHKPCANAPLHPSDGRLDSANSLWTPGILINFPNVRATIDPTNFYTAVSLIVTCQLIIELEDYDQDNNKLLQIYKNLTMIVRKNSGDIDKAAPNQDQQ